MVEEFHRGYALLLLQRAVAHDNALIPCPLGRTAHCHVRRVLMENFDFPLRATRRFRLQVHEATAGLRYVIFIKASRNFSRLKHRELSLC